LFCANPSAPCIRDVRGGGRLQHPVIDSDPAGECPAGFAAHFDRMMVGGSRLQFYNDNPPRHDLAGVKRSAGLV